jgi:hypothetical protein
LAAVRRLIFNTFSSGRYSNSSPALSLPCTILYDKYFIQKKWAKHIEAGNYGIVPQEYRLWPAIAGSLLLPIGLFWFAWTAKPNIHWIVPALSTIPFAWGNMLIFVSRFYRLLRDVASERKRTS